MKRIQIVLTSLLAVIASAENAATNPLPIHEVTLFKDGHAFIQHSGTMPVNEDGKIVMDYLPAPVLGTFWPYVDDPNATLRSVVSGTKKVDVEKTALTIQEMILANMGKQVLINEGGNTYQATLLGIPTRSSEEIRSYTGTSIGPVLSQKGDLVLVKTTQGTKTVPFSRITDVIFLSEQRTKLNVEEFQKRLTLDLKWKDQPHTQANVGMVYLQRGIRWIPKYSLSIDDAGQAVLKLEATLINELIDLNDVTANLVIGVPTFAFQDSVDPIALRESIARLSSSFRNNSRTAFALSNAIMSQMALPSSHQMDSQPSNGETLNLGPEISGSHSSEDLYLFTINHITLKKGERMVLPIGEYNLSYTDIYTVDIPIVPPTEIFRRLNQTERMNILQTSFAPKVMHKMRIKNQTQHPFTTAPAVILKNDRIIAQGMMTYTSIGGTADISLTTAVDINVKKSDHETKRTDNNIRINGDSYSRVDLEGNFSLKNFKNKAVTVEITRHVLGILDQVDETGQMKMINPLEDRSYLPSDSSMDWWYQYSWPWWWYHVNSVGRVTWNDTIEPGQTIEHTYSWHYYWQ